MSAIPAISVAGLTKSYTETTGLFDLDLEVPPEAVTALLDPNGAGTTTAVRLMATLSCPPTLCPAGCASSWPTSPSVTPPTPFARSSPTSLSATTSHLR
jgi:hypothetical protein